MTNSEIGQRIALLRGNETQESLAKAIGVSREIIQHWERGTRHIKADHLSALAYHFGCPIDTICGQAAAMHGRTEVALTMVKRERQRQDALWGDQSGNHPFEWMSILGEEFGELCEAVNETFFKNGTHPDRGGNEKIIKETTQVAAVAVAIIEAAQRDQELKMRRMV